MAIRTLVPESRLIPFKASFPPGKRWLVLAPHADDETLGPGATLALARQRGIAVSVAIATDGAVAGDPAAREREAIAAAGVLGIDPPAFWKLADRQLAPGSRELRSRILDTLRSLAPDTVLVTSPVEMHPDHRALALALQRALRRILLDILRGRGPAWVLAYEVSTLLAPNLLVPAEEAWTLKREALRRYPSQTEQFPYAEMMEARGTLRTLTLRNSERAEAFHLLSARGVARRSARAWASLMGSAAGV